MTGRGKAVGLAAGVVALAVAAVVAVRLVAGGVAAEPVVIGVDLPFQGASRTASEETWNAMQLYLERAGRTEDVSLRRYDNSTVAKGTWDEASCAENANTHIANASEVAVIGPQHVGCAKAAVPVLNPAGLVMVSHAVSNPGLTTAWGPGEPGVYSPSGSPTFARVITTDDVQGAAAARYAVQKLKVARCLVLNDGELYGRRVATGFADEARRQGLEVVERSWDRAHQSYADVFASVRPDCVFLGGNYDNNGGQLVTDKVAVLGDHTAVKLLVPDGFGGYPAFLRSSGASGAYATSVGLSMDAWRGLGGRTADFLAAYEDRHRAAPSTMYALYGVLALQVVLAAVDASDRTRKGVRDAVFSGVSVPADVCVLGRAVAVVGATGDIDARDISVGQVKDGAVTFLEAQALT